MPKCILHNSVVIHQPGFLSSTGMHPTHRRESYALINTFSTALFEKKPLYRCMVIAGCAVVYILMVICKKSKCACGKIIGF